MIVPMTIIIPTLNEEKGLPILLKTLTTQTALPKEIIIADSNSTDKTREVAKKFGCKIVEGGNHPSVARNHGAAVASEEILLFLDADVSMSPTFLENTYKEMTQRQLEVASCYLEPISDKRIDKIGTEIINVYLRYSEARFPHTSGFCIFATKKLHNKINGFNEHIVLGEDIDYGQKAGKAGKFGFLTSEKIYVSIRRYEEEGRVRTLVKNMFAAYVIGHAKDKTKLPFVYSFGKHKGQAKEKN